MEEKCMVSMLKQGYPFDLNNFREEEGLPPKRKEIHQLDVDDKLVHAFDLNKSLHDEEELHATKEMQSMVTEIIKILSSKIFSLINTMIRIA